MSFLDQYQDKTVLVTGGAGAIGSNLTRALSAVAKRVIVLDNLVASPRWNVPSLPNVLFVEGDILDEVKLKRVFFERPQIVFHLAAFFANQNSVDHPENDLMVNGMGTLRLMEYGVLQGIERFVYASSGCSIYGQAAPLPLTEDFMSMHLTTPYQITKMLGELYGNFFHHHYNLPVVKARFFNSYGPGEVPGPYRNVIPKFMGDEGPALADHRHGRRDPRLHLGRRHHRRALARGRGARGHRPRVQPRLGPRDPDPHPGRAHQRRRGQRGRHPLR